MFALAGPLGRILRPGAGSRQQLDPDARSRPAGAVFEEKNKKLMRIKRRTSECISHGKRLGVLHIAVRHRCCAHFHHGAHL